MAGRPRKNQIGEPFPNAPKVSPALSRMESIRTNLEEGSSDSDSTWFLPYLTEKQRMYGILYTRFLGDWAKAAKAAGYAPGTRQTQIESGDAMVAYMTAVKAEVAQVVGLSATTVVARMNRIALKAEDQGDLKTAMGANRTLGEWQGLGEKRVTVTHQNADGVSITIGSPRSTADDEVYIDAEIVEIMEQNGFERPELPQKEIDGAID